MTHRKPLSVKEIERLSKHPGRYAVGGVPGLTFRVNQTKTGTSCKWYLRKEINAEEINTMLGSYPVLGLHDARLKALEVLRDISNGLNPVEEKKREAAEKKEKEKRLILESLTVGDILKEWMSWKVEQGDWGKGQKDKAIKAQKITLGMFRTIAPKALDLLVYSASPRDVAESLKPNWCTKRRSSDVILAHLHSIFEWAVFPQQYRPDNLANPANAKRVRSILPNEILRKERRNQPALEIDQLPLLVKSLMEKGGFSCWCTVAAILTSVRSENIRCMRWDQLNEDLTLWEIDPEDMKVITNGQHKITISPQLKEVLLLAKEHSTGSKYVFPSIKNNGKPFSIQALLYQIQTAHEIEVKEGREGFIDRAMTKKKGSPVVATLHGIARSTFKTWAEDTRQDTKAVELILHHSVDKKYKGAYDRSIGLSYKQKVLDEWGKVCFSLISHTP